MAEFKKPHGLKKLTKNLKLLREKYDPDNVNLLRMNSKMINQEGEGRILTIFEPDDVKVCVLLEA